MLVPLPDPERLVLLDDPDDPVKLPDDPDEPVKLPLLLLADEPVKLPPLPLLPLLPLELDVRD